MGRPVTLFTGQWADLPLEELAAKAGAWGFDGLELACWGDHFEVDKAIADPSYVRGRWEILNRHGLQCFAISNHLVGQCVCDRIDDRHRAILPPEIWGDGDPEGVRRRAAQRLKDTARAAARFGVDRVNGFTGSSIWYQLYSFPPNDFAEVEKGYQDFAARFGPIMDVFASEGAPCSRSIAESSHSIDSGPAYLIRFRTRITVQLPLRSGGAAGPGDAGSGRAGRGLPLPRPLPAGVDR